MTTVRLLAAGVALASVGGWWLVYALALLLTRPARPEPAPPTQDLGAEPPAVASLLVGGWDLTEDAAEATLIDLAARRLLEFRQPGNDPAQTTVHVRDPNPAGLNRYERLIFDRVSGLAVGGVVPLPALAFRDPAQAAGFGRRVRAAVVADCRARGLSRRRFGPAELTVLNVTALAAGSGLAVAALWATRSVMAAGVIWLFATLLLVGLGNRSIGERDTLAGRAACARWLGVRTWLGNTEAFAELPPAAVAVWDRYLSYGAALGVTRVTSAVIDLGLGTRRRVWSSFGGTWHRVRVRYPRFWLRYGQPAQSLFVRGIVATVAGVLIISLHARIVAIVLGASSVARWQDPARGVGLLVGVVVLGYGLYLMVRTTIDVARPVRLTGEVLWQQVWRSTSEGEDSPARPWLHYLAIDDGTGDRTTAWGLPSEHAGRCGAGDGVRITARRWSRRVLDLEVVTENPARRLAALQPTPQDTEALVASEMGVSGVRFTNGVPVRPAESLLTVDEVGRAVGVPVSMLSASSPGSQAVSAGTVRFQAPDGRTVVTLMMAGGMGGKLSMLAHRGNPRLPGIGDEAYTGKDWAVASWGGVVVSVSARGGPPVDPRNLHWLLATAMSRLPATAMS